MKQLSFRTGAWEICVRSAIFRLNRGIHPALAIGIETNLHQSWQLATGPGGELQSNRVYRPTLLGAALIEGQRDSLVSANQLCGASASFMQGPEFLEISFRDVVTNKRLEIDVDVYIIVSFHQIT